MNFTNDVVIHETTNGMSYLKFRKLMEFKNIVHGVYVGCDLDFRTRDRYGIDHMENVVNYKKFLSVFNLDYKTCIKANQKHSKNYKIVYKKINDDAPDFSQDYYNNTDALITNQKNMTLITTMADCNGILVYDKKTKTIATIHSGWKGTLDEIVINTLKGMHDNFNTNYEDLICCITPSIRKCCFEVDNDVYLKFKNKFSDNSYYTYNNKWHIDLVKIIIDSLLKLGVKKENILDSNICTCCNYKYFNSYRYSSKHSSIKSNLGMAFICKVSDIDV